MKPSTRSASRWAAVAGILLLASAAGPLAANDSAIPALKVEGVTVARGEVQLTVTNPSVETRRGTVWVRVLLRDRVAEAIAPVTVPGGQKVFLELTLPAPAEAVMDTGAVLDDGTPF